MASLRRTPGDRFPVSIFFKSHRAKLALLSCVAYVSLGSGQTSYYISAGGSDANDGISASTPWKTISKVNSVTFVPGDAILFRRGEEFFGQININQPGTQNLPLTIGAYGPSDLKPVITGAIRPSNWTVYKGSIYFAKTPAMVKNLFADGVQMTLARYPNSGFLPVAATNGATTISAAGIGSAPVNWQGANLRLRSSDYAFETRTIASSSGSSITLSSPTTLSIREGFGFFLDNALAALDTAGEWYCDPATNSLYFYPPGGVDPNTLAVEASTQDYGINSAQSFVDVQGVSFRCQANAALRFKGPVSNIRLFSNDIIGALVDGIRFEGLSTDCTIDGNTVNGVNNRGIALLNTSRTTISNNTVKNVGLVQGYSIGIDPEKAFNYNGASGIVFWNGSHNLVSGNFIDSIGYIGIRPDGGYHIVEKNLITNVMLTMADGGALYSLGTNGAITTNGIWRNNIIKNVVGNNAGVPQPSWTNATGIYLDMKSYRMRIEDNTIFRAHEIGIYIQIDSYLDTVRGNVLYDCASDPGGVFCEIDLDTTYHYGQNIITRNVFFPTNSQQLLMRVKDPTTSPHSPGTLDSNYWCNPYGNMLPFETLLFDGSWHYTRISYAQWKALWGQDQHSKGLYKSIVPFAVTDSSAQDLMQNGKFTSDIAGWSSWDQNTQLKYAADQGLDNGCLEFRLLRPTPASWGGITAPQVSLKRGEWYRLTFSVRAPQPGVISTFVEQNYAPYNDLTIHADFPMGPARRDHEWFFSIPTTAGQSTVNFQLNYPDSLVYLDNVVLRIVKGSYLPPEYQAPLFVNSTARVLTVNPGPGSFCDLDGKPVTGSIDLAPYSSRILIRASSSDIGTSADDRSASTPDRYALYQNYPNPFNPSTVIGYVLPSESKVRLEVFDVIGRLLTTLVDETQKAGYHRVSFSREGLSTGVYFYRLNAGSYVETRKFLLVR